MMPRKSSKPTARWVTWWIRIHPTPLTLHIGKPQYEFSPVKVIYHKQPGTVELVYEISEGKPFRTGNINVKGNTLTQQKVILRELHVAPGQLYNSGELERCCRATAGFAGIFGCDDYTDW